MVLHPAYVLAQPSCFFIRFLELTWSVGKFPTGFITLTSAPRVQHENNYLSAEGDHIKTNRHLYIGKYDLYEFLAESVPARPGHITLSYTSTHPPFSRPDPMYLSTNGHSAVMDLWPMCDSGRQIWTAARSPQNPNHWTFTVGGGNTEDSSRIQLSCGVADKAGEPVDLWSEHKWELQPLRKTSQSSGGNCTKPVLPTMKVWQPCLSTIYWLHVVLPKVLCSALHGAIYLTVCA